MLVLAETKAYAHNSQKTPSRTILIQTVTHNLRKLIYILFFICQFSFGQTPEFKIDNLLKTKMEILNVDEIGFTRKSCTGNGVDSNAYLFWKADSKTMMQKIEYIEYPKEHLKEYKPIIINDDFFFKSFLENKEEITSESDIKRFQLEVKEDNANEMVSTGFPMTSHSCYRLIRIQTHYVDFRKDFDYFKLTKSLGHSDEKLNINFDFNKELEIVKYDELINYQIENIEKSTEFEMIAPE